MDRSPRAGLTNLKDKNRTRSTAPNNEVRGWKFLKEVACGKGLLLLLVLNISRVFCFLATQDSSEHYLALHGCGDHGKVDS